jgi:hypothetical protein
VLSDKVVHFPVQKARWAKFLQDFQLNQYYHGQVAPTALHLFPLTALREIHYQKKKTLERGRGKKLLHLMRPT